MSSASESMPEKEGSVPSRGHGLGKTGRQVFQSLSLGLVVFDPSLRIVHHNPAAELFVQKHRSVADVLTQTTLDAQYQDWPSVLREVIESGREARFDQVLYRDGQLGERLLDLLCIPLPDESTGSITGGTLVIEDVTAAVSMEKRLAVSERMAAVGKLAARVAHELNNPLDGILRYLNLALRAVELDKADRIEGYLTQARGGLLRMAEIVRELVEFSRNTATTFDDAGINSILEEAVKVMSDKAVQNKVSIVSTLSDEMPAVRGASLFQVFCNLIKNAIDAMPEGGTLSLQTRVLDREAIIRFEDTGEGLPEEIDRIFEPFFTTKEPGKGTGLGLPICREILEKCNGRIVPERRPEGGTVFTVRLPLESCVVGRNASIAAGSDTPAKFDQSSDSKEPC